MFLPSAVLLADRYVVFDFRERTFLYSVDVFNVLNRFEVAVFIAVINDGLRFRLANTGQLVQFLGAGGIDVHRLAGRQMAARS